MNIKVLNPGLFTTIQDLGRPGFQKYGVVVGGAMDLEALRIANILVGNKEGEAAFEITLIGPELMLEKGTLLAITGADISPTIDGRDAPMWRPIYLKEDSLLKFGPCKSGCRSYLAFAGGFKLKNIMESKSTYIKAGIGGYKGRTLKKDDIIELENSKEASIDIIKRISSISSMNKYIFPKWYVNHIKRTKGKVNSIRVFRERQFENFTQESINEFFKSQFNISVKSDRMGYRLNGVKLNLREPLEMISEPVYLGTIQVPPDGNPIILLADRQTIGGYPKIAQIASVDISKIVQLKPNEKVIFKKISLEEAKILYFKREKSINDIRNALKFKVYR
ncbi:KipI antagonist [Clostridium pasteurianum DSM 525 = ATCC 6013]|uniref:KipI antagonist n=1 Tax=Clostridium pasteurianum DSM 525 = ATCC 6013 TaxID=1262449 RepID=A0A0H3JAX4_CLOPA|nr:biotin-dependent carboxyltransferase family protein [Clostridium pasteurianum]AJA49953.1 KipI antagonist [Clostridium pasteurianum DSM 525 = ATCC 6013]AJA53941.1 KipI antagonist [Clostridium pasteurianum DSM 525 = ATCC 6013]AOZ77087.1 KipI antagonist [Clostridium pasteurianum DSM 525 = ATCC 6013]AOZ80884.1 KipI antagonist [Clostridium pasteurianum]ELP59335.1 urea amidolyase-like protein [Clostridium pasteurianum DSM 525 = ATCC 6013]